MDSIGDTPYPKYAPIIPPVVPLPGYIAIDNGMIISPKGKMLKQHPDGNGGLKVNIGDTTVGVHTIILRAFTGNPPKWLKLRPQWRDGNRSNNRLENLMWGKKPRKRR